MYLMPGDFDPRDLHARERDEGIRDLRISDSTNTTALVTVPSVRVRHRWRRP
jgi:hypothetical protein